jgi:hypothetical protein
MPAELLGVDTANPKLIGDGRIALTVRRIPGVKGNLHQNTPTSGPRRASLLKHLHVSLLRGTTRKQMDKLDQTRIDARPIFDPLEICLA